MLSHVFRGSPLDPAAFVRACQALAAAACRTQCSGRLVGASGEVLATVGVQGRLMPALPFTPEPLGSRPPADAAPSMACASEPPADGWYRTAADVTYYVHEGRPFVDGFDQAGAELIEAFCSRGGK